MKVFTKQRNVKQCSHLVTKEERKSAPFDRTLLEYHPYFCGSAIIVHMRMSEKSFYRKIYIIIGLSVCILVGLFYLLLTDFGVDSGQVATVPTSTPIATTVPTPSAAPTTTPEPTMTPEPTSTPEPVVTVDTVSDDSYQRIVNASQTIRSDYVPSDLRGVTVAQEGSQSLRQEANEQLAQMFAAAQQDGIQLVVISGYRSYAREEELYQFWLSYAGRQAADEIDCQPGRSEHQLGLAVDIGAQNQACRLDECFASTPEGQWLQAHAQDYGYIERYPQGKKEITGIIYSPWNYRYVGKEEAIKLKESHQTMEEYYGENE